MIKRGHTHYAATGKTSKLVRQMFNVDGVQFVVTGKLKGSAKRQTIIHFGQPNSVIDRRDCGIPVQVYFPQTGETVETCLVPQWRFGKGMRTNAVKRLMRGKSLYRVTESRKSGKSQLVVQFH